jgi:hypothetical protein
MDREMDKPIIVEGTDGTLEIHAGFRTALEWVKGLKGRKWNPTSKMWEVPMGVESIKGLCPFDSIVRLYSLKKERETKAVEFDREISSKLRGKLEAFGFQSRAVEMLASEIEEWISVGDGAISRLEKKGKLAKASREQIDFLYKVEDWFRDEQIRLEDSIWGD